VEERLNPKYFSTTPKNSWELLQWLFVEPFKLYIFSEKISKKEAYIWFIKVYPIFMFFSFLLYFFISVTIAYFGTTVFYNVYFQSSYSDIFTSIDSKYDKLSLLLKFNLFSQGLDFFTGLISGLFITHIIGLRWGMASALFSALLAMTLSVPVIDTIIYVYLLAFIIGIVLGFLSQFSAYDYRHIVSVICAAITAFFFTLINGANVNIIIIFTGYIIFWGFHSYFYHLFRSIFFKVDLENNYYLKDMYSVIPIIGVKRKLAQDAFLYPSKAYDFSYFLFEYRAFKNHRKLAFYLMNVADASFFYHNRLSSKNIVIPDDYEKNQPKKNFLTKLKELKNELEKYQVQHNLHHKKISLSKIIKILKILETQMLIEKRAWSEYYLKAIRANLNEANARLKNLELEAKNREPITPNIYNIGDPLSPNYQNQLFKGRKDVVDRLSNIIYTSAQMPLLLIQGQRRVGKTSLINYLEQLLGSGFKIVKLDMQSATNKRFDTLVQNINQELNDMLGIDETIETSDDILQSWIAFEQYLTKHTKALNYKIIIAFDEYESFHKHIVKKHGEDILENMRSFMQSQNQVIFLFAGMLRISDLTSPNWDEYFPHAQRLKVDYLSREESLELITNPVEDFNLVYADEVANKVYELTSGHPQLLQTICSIIVNIANSENQKNITKEMVAKAKEQVFEINEMPMTIFWREFCDDAEREIMEQILANEEIIKETKEQKRAVARLIDYGFIGADMTIRVPLFEKWLVERRDSLEL